MGEQSSKLRSSSDVMKRVVQIRCARSEIAVIRIGPYPLACFERRQAKISGAKKHTSWQMPTDDQNR